MTEWRDTAGAPSAHGTRSPGAGRQGWRCRRSRPSELVGTIESLQDFVQNSEVQLMPYFRVKTIINLK